MLIPVFSDTDDERYKILKNCSDMLLSAGELSSEFTEEINLRIDKYLDIFDKIRAYDKYIADEREKQDEDFSNLFEKASVFVRHYFITMHMAIERGELPLNTTDYYDFKYPFGVPEFKSDVQLIKTAQKLFDDDLKRTSEGGKYFTNPGIGAVKVWVEKFIEAVENKNNKYHVKGGKVENIDKIRKETNVLLQEIFDTLICRIGVKPEAEDLKFLLDCGFEFNFIDDNGIQIVQTSIEVDNNEKTQKSSKIKPDQLKFDL
ncbi:MAG: hypothetical protein PHE33_06540 [Bacteroidales bacterium]|nr:hypothetical protein [Bacteroidales bacterium]